MQEYHISNKLEDTARLIPHWLLNCMDLCPQTMGRTPMDIEHEFGWSETRDRRDAKCSYLSPPKKRRLEPIATETARMELVRVHPAQTPAVKTRERVMVNIARIPVVMIGYLHLVLNFVVVGLACYAVAYILICIQRDIVHKVTNRRTEIEQEIAEAQGQYEINRCDPQTRVPALEELCNQWECVIRNGYGSVGYTRIIAEVLGDVLDGFVKKFSVRSSLVMGFFLVLFLVFRRGAKG